MYSSVDALKLSGEKQWMLPLQLIIGSPTSHYLTKTTSYCYVVVAPHDEGQSKFHVFSPISSRRIAVERGSIRRYKFSCPFFFHRSGRALVNISQAGGSLHYILHNFLTDSVVVDFKEVQIGS